MKAFLLLLLIHFSSLNLFACFDCPEPEGIFADPTDTHYYYNCGAGKAYRIKCNAGLVWNSYISECDFTNADTTPIVAASVSTTSEQFTTVHSETVTTVTPVHTSTLESTTEQRFTTSETPPPVTCNLDGQCG